MTVTRVKTTAGWLDLNTTGPKGDKGDPGYYEYSYIASAGATKDLSTPAGTWGNLAIPTTPVNINQPAGAFVVNANGSMTVRDAGIYDIEASVTAVAAWATANIRMITGLGVGATAIAAADVIARADSTVSVASEYPTTTLAGSYYLAAGSIIWVTYFGVANAGTASCAHFSIVRMGAGPQGAAGAAGAPGPATLETYIGPNAPSPRGDYTVWIDTDEPQASWLPPTRVTSLPASPFDGQEIYYVADAANGVIWHLRYNASGGTYKWEFVGGSPLYSAVDAAMTMPSTSVWSDPSSNIGPDIINPLAGDYRFSFTASLYANGVASDIQAGLAAPGGTPTASTSSAVYVPVAAHGVPVAHKVLLTLAAGATTRLRYWGNGGSGQFMTAQQRRVEAFPVRVG